MGSLHARPTNWILLCLLTTGLLYPVASVPAPNPQRSLMSLVIPKPTGQNGYEEFLAAADLVRRRDRAVDAAVGGTLNQKRAVLATSECARALQLLRRGLRKRVWSPRAVVDWGTPTPEFGQFRRLARLLAVEQYVLFADCRTRQAVESLSDGFRFGRAIHTELPLSDWCSLFTVSMVLREFGRHLDQLGASDCESVFRLCGDWLRSPGIEERAIELRRQAAVNTLSGLSTRPELFQDAFGEDGNELAKRAHDDPSGFSLEVRTATQVVDDYFGRIREELTRPTWERSFTVLPEDPSPHGRLAAAVVPVFNTAMDACIIERARLQMLACHAAIRRYRWEHDRLPESLDELRLGALAIDPFNGRPFRYTRRDHGYELISIGPADRQGNDPRAVDGRIPIVVGPR